MNKFKIHYYFNLLILLFICISCNDNNKNKVESHIVIIKGMKFIPDDIKANKGDRIIWINKDIVPHNIVSDDKTYKSEILQSNDSLILDATSNFRYICGLHPVMKGNINLENKD